MVSLGVALVVFSGALATWATVHLSRANRFARLPWAFRRPPQVPWQVPVLGGLAAATAIAGVALLGTDWGYWSVLALPGAWVVSYAVRYAHNRAVVIDH